MKRKCYHLAVSLLAAFFLLSPSHAHALAIADSSVSLSNLQISPSTGTIQFSDPWTAEAFAQAANSLGELDAVFDSTTTGTAQADASVTWAEGHGTSSTVDLTANAASAVNLPGFNNQASSIGQGSLFNTFMIIGGTGSVEVEFSLVVDGFLHGLADAVGSFATEIIAALEVDGSPVLFDHRTLAGGPNFPDTSVLVSEFLTNTLILEFGVPYFLFVQADSESRGMNVPEPGTVVLLLVGLVMLVGLTARLQGRHEARA